MILQSRPAARLPLPLIPARPKRLETAHMASEVAHDVGLYVTARATPSPLSHRGDPVRGWNQNFASDPLRRVRESFQVTPRLAPSCVQCSPR